LIGRRTAHLVALTALGLMAASCGGPPRGEPTVEVGVPSIEPQRVTIRTLEPGPSPTPTPVPTPTPTPGPTPAPLAPPRGASIKAASGTQQGAVSSYCWSSGNSTQCVDTVAPNQASALAVKEREKTLLRIDADQGPDDESVRPFQGSRSGYPSSKIQPALETELTIDLAPGEWMMDVCATWYGHGEPVCWLFRLEVRKG
jgi:hypothetical protein